MDYLYYLFVVLGFLAVVLLLEGMYLAWNSYKGPEARRIEARLLAMSAGAGHENSTLVKQRLLAQTPGLERLLLEIPRIHQLDRLIVQSGLRLSVAKFIGLMVVALVSAIAIAVLAGFPVIVIAAIGFIACFLPLIYTKSAKHKRMLAIEQQLPDALDLMARAMMAGHALPSALQMVGRDHVTSC